MYSAASPFALYSVSMGPDFDLDVLDGFDDIKTEVANELRLQSSEALTWRPREISIHLGHIGKQPAFFENLQG